MKSMENDLLADKIGQLEGGAVHEPRRIMNLDVRTSLRSSEGCVPLPNRFCRNGVLVAIIRQADSATQEALERLRQMLFTVVTSKKPESNIFDSICLSNQKRSKWQE